MSSTRKRVTPRGSSSGSRSGAGPPAGSARPGPPAAPTATPSLEQRALALVPPLVKEVLFTQRYFPHVAALVLALDAGLTMGIIWRVPYTEIDFSTYMVQSSLFLRGERDYTHIEGPSGPCVYPALHLYLYSLISRLTASGSNLRLAQYLFGLIYLFSQASIMALYHSLGLPAVLLPALALSKRLHSIFVLRLFNDGPAMALVWCGLALLARSSGGRDRRYTLGAVCAVGLALGIKMNVLLLLPTLFLALFRAGGALHAGVHLLLLGAIQAALALPFVREHPGAYLGRAFDLRRQFLYKWTVNWRFLPESVFTSPALGHFLLFLHMGLLALFGIFKWTSVSREGLLPWLSARLRRGEPRPLTARELVLPTLTANLLGILCARSLHYQFYAWYAQTLPLLLWSAALRSAATKWVILPLGIEMAWNTFPSTEQSSVLLLGCNALLAVGLWRMDWEGDEQGEGEGRDRQTSGATDAAQAGQPRRSPRKPKKKTRGD